MAICLAVFGEEYVWGQKFPRHSREDLRKMMLEQQEGEGLAQWQCRRFIAEKANATSDARVPKHVRDFEDLNPEGFWEMAFSVTGITPYAMQQEGPAYFSPQLQSLLDQLDDGVFRVMKVVSQGLLPSNPKYIGKILYSIRHPRAVAKSQERLERGFKYIGDDGQSHNAFEDKKVHTPEMYIQVTKMAAIFLLRNPEIPVHFHHFEDLLADPKEVIDRIGAFVGHGDFTKAYDIVQQKLNRSKHEEDDSPLWEDALPVYEHFCAAASVINTYIGDDPEKTKEVRKEAAPHLMALLEYLSDRRRSINREKRKWLCYRAKHEVSEAICKECIAGLPTQDNLKFYSEQNPSQLGVTKHWSEEPCLWECGMDPDREDYVTIEDSVKKNFWSKPDAVS